MFRLVERRRLYFLFSGLIITAGIITLIISTSSTGTPLQLSIDFTGGTLLSLQFREEVDEQAIRDVLKDFELDNIVVQKLSAIEEIDFPENSRWSVTTERNLTNTEFESMLVHLEQTIGPIDRDNTDKVVDRLRESGEIIIIQFDQETNAEAINNALKSFDVDNTTWEEVTEEDPAYIAARWSVQSTSVPSQEDWELFLDRLDQLVAPVDRENSLFIENPEVEGTAILTVQFNQTVTDFDLVNALPQYPLVADSLQLEPTTYPDGSRWSVRTEELTLEDVTAIESQMVAEIAPLDRAATVTSQVSESVGREVTRAAVLATIAASFVILGFVWWAFRKVPHAIRYGACAIVAMLHDIMIMVSAMSIMGMVFDWQVDALFLTALLTVVGFSVQDSIVVFDRIRENIPRRRGESYELIVNRSVLETVHRSLATQLNAIFVMIAIILFGGETIRQFVVILLIGLSSGTYSSIFIAVPLLVAWSKGEIPFLKPAQDEE